MIDLDPHELLLSQAISDENLSPAVPSRTYLIRLNLSFSGMATGELEGPTKISPTIPLNLSLHVLRLKIHNFLSASFWRLGRPIFRMILRAKFFT